MLRGLGLIGRALHLRDRLGLGRPAVESIARTEHASSARHLEPSRLFVSEANSGKRKYLI
jgi:hypothetical protein